MQKEPPPFVWAAPEEKNILHCEYALLSCAYVDHVAELVGIRAGYFIVVRQTSHLSLFPRFGISHAFSISLRSGDRQIAHTRAVNIME
jgi:hypothetical protein